MIVIIFKIGSDVGVVYPYCALPLDEIARRSVPRGVNYAFIDRSEIPHSKEERNIKFSDDSIYIDGVGESDYDRSSDGLLLK